VTSHPTANHFFYDSQAVLTDFFFGAVAHDYFHTSRLLFPGFLFFPFIFVYYFQLTTIHPCKIKLLLFLKKQGILEHFLLIEENVSEKVRRSTTLDWLTGRRQCRRMF